MKTKMYAAAIAIMAIAGILRATQVVAEPSCPGTGILCATAGDGTSYYKGGGQLEIEVAN